MDGNALTLSLTDNDREEVVPAYWVAVQDSVDRGFGTVCAS